MHPLVYYAIVEFDRNEMLHKVEMERQRRDLHERQQLERSGLRVGHGRVAPARGTALSRLTAALRGRSAPTRVATSARVAASARTTASPGRSSGGTAAIGCRA